jgi:outer membrane protein TolC
MFYLRKSKPFFGVVVLLLVIFNASGSDTLTYHGLLEKALEHNYHIRWAKIRQKQSEIAHNRGMAGQLPTVEFAGNLVQNINNSKQVFFTGETRSGNNAKSTNINNFVQLNWTLFDGFRMFAEKNKLHLMEQSEGWLLKNAMEETIFDLTILYAEWVLEMKKWMLMKEHAQTNIMRVRMEEQKLSLGKNNLLDVLAAKSDLALDSLTMIAHENKLLQIQQLMDHAIGTEIGFVYPNLPPALPECKDVTYHPEYVSDRLSSNNPTIQHLQQAIMLADNNMVLERAARFPELGLSIGYGMNRNFNEIGFIQRSNNSGLSAGLQVRYRLYDGHKVATRIALSEMEKKFAELQLERQKTMFEQQMTTIIKQLDNLQKEQEVMAHHMQFSLQLYELAKEQFLQSTISSLEWRTAQENHLKWSLLLDDHQHRLFLCKLHMSRLMGKMLEDLFDPF